MLEGHFLKKARYSLINDVNNAVVGQNVGRNDLGRVNKQAVARVGESKLGAVESGQARVCQGVGVKGA